MGFREVLPVFLGHLGLHRFDLEAGGVKDAAVVGAPEFVLGVGVRGLGLIGAFGEVDFFSIPVDGLVGGEDRPVHAGEALLEERGGERDDEVIGLEPSDELFAVVRGVADLSEADEGVHFMDVAADVFRHGAEGEDIGVGGE